MGAGGEATKSTTDTWQHEPQADSSRAGGDGNGGSGDDLRRRREPSGKPLHKRTSSLERLTELADWKRIGLHKKYADATMVGFALGWDFIFSITHGYSLLSFVLRLWLGLRVAGWGVSYLSCCLCRLCRLYAAIYIVVYHLRHLSSTPSIDVVSSSISVTHHQPQQFVVVDERTLPPEQTADARLAAPHRRLCGHNADA